MPVRLHSNGKGSVLSGDSGDNYLDGRGPSLLLKGAGGNDYYVVDDAGDIVEERKNGGHDTVEAYIDWTLPDNVEDLILGGSEDLSGTGNEKDNVLSGNAGANVLAGGDGSDTLFGGEGDDTLEGGAGSDNLEGGAGSDTAIFSGAWEDYLVTVDDGIVTVHSADGETDSLTEIEYLEFSDGIISVADLIGEPTPEPEPDPAPLPTDDTASVLEDGEILLDLLANDGAGLAITSLGEPSKGQVWLNEDGTVTYRPLSDQYGPDSFTYTVMDGNGQKASATVSLDVDEVNDAPLGVDDVFDSAANVQEVSGVPNVLANDMDIDDDALFVSGLVSGGQSQEAAHNFEGLTEAGGLISLNADGSFSYTPPEQFAGTDSFTYLVADGRGGESTATVTLNVQLPGIAAADDDAVVNEDGSVVIALLVNDAGDGLTLASVSDGTFGSVRDNGDGTVTYTPLPDANGTDFFSYSVVDTFGQTSSANVTVEVYAVNDGPVANADTFSVEAGAVLTGNVLTNDTDPEGDTLTAEAGTFSTDNGGSVTMNADGTFEYTAADGSSGEDSFGYTVSDGADSASGTVTVSVFASQEPEPEPNPEPDPEPAYYVTGLISGETSRLNYPDPLGEPTVVTFAFLASVPDYYPDDSFVRDGFAAFTDAQREATLGILSSLESFTNLTFVEVSLENAEMTFGLAELPGMLGLAVMPSGQSGVGSSASDVWIDASYAGDEFIAGSEQFHTLLHEIGHALGLKHADLPVAEENAAYTVMDSANHPTMIDTAETYQMYDIAALQYLYGVNELATAADNVYSFADLDGTVMTIWDAGGHDLIDVSNAGYGVSIDLNEGAFSTIDAVGTNNLALALGTTIEDAIGGDHNDVISGNDVDNWIDGGAGNDTLSGGGGLDTYAFGSNWGQDTIDDFTIGEDRLDFSGTGFTLDDMLITLVDGNTQISDGENIVTLSGVEEKLDETMLIF